MNDACVGDYGVQAELPGFETGIRSGITLTVGREAVVNLRLSVGEVTQSVEVTGEAPRIQTGASEIGGVVARLGSSTDLRHRFATRLVDNGAEPIPEQQSLGHLAMLK